MSENTTYQVSPIGYVRGEPGNFRLEITEPYRPALKELGQFSHVIVLWFAHECDTGEARAVLQARPNYAKGEVLGIFATRSPARPNPIVLDICAVMDIDEDAGIITTPWIDAFDGSPILDLKCFVPMADRPRHVRVAGYLSDWPEWQEDAANFDFDPALFEPYED
ncbi:MAG: SAM-dependent methyltransferase [Anaerolineae bacterium]|nr:SAM-dependent methyltransferase [Anaerolineae bacterium]